MVSGQRAEAVLLRKQRTELSGLQTRLAAGRAEHLRERAHDLQRLQQRYRNLMSDLSVQQQAERKDLDTPRLTSVPAQPRDRSPEAAGRPGRVARPTAGPNASALVRTQELGPGPETQRQNRATATKAMSTPRRASGHYASMPPRTARGTGVPTTRQ